MAKLLRQNIRFKKPFFDVTRYYTTVVSEEGELVNDDLHLALEEAISTPIAGFSPKWKAPSQAVELIKSGHNVFIHGMAATPTPLLEGLCRHALNKNLNNVTLYHLHLEGDTKWTAPEYDGIIRSNSLFTGSNLRKAVNTGISDAVPIFLSQIPQLFRTGLVEMDVALIHCSVPDRKGYCSLGTCVDTTRAALTKSRKIIALANPNMPRTLGDAILHSSHVDIMVYCDMLPYTRPLSELKHTEAEIGRKIAETLVEDGATIQMGIGSIPDACLAAMKNHKNLGVHTEMFSDGVLDLVNCGAITNALKKIHPGKIVSSFVFGSDKLYQFINDNPMIMMGDISWVNDVAVIRRNQKATAINSAVEVDLTGQVVSDSIGKYIISGFGGQLDFINGAALCDDGRGKPIIALPSTTKNGATKIVPFLQPGAGVVTTRANVQYIVTEYGIAMVFGKNMRQRAYDMIRIAHPDHRETLEKAAFERLKCMPSPD